jgi:hypothetical protein
MTTFLAANLARDITRVINDVAPRTISIRRSTEFAPSDLGAQPPQGLTETSETILASGLTASIQRETRGTAEAAHLPGDIATRIQWRIIVPGVAFGTIEARDVIQDELGDRFQVLANYWVGFGYKLLCETLLT